MNDSRRLPMESPRASVPGPFAVLNPARLLLGLTILLNPLGDSSACLAESSGAESRALPAGWSSSFVHAPEFDSRMFVVEAGEPGKPPVLLIHGLGKAGSEDWHSIIPGLEQDYHVIAPDLPGFGRSDIPKGTLSPRRYAQTLRWLIHSMDLGPVRLVGHSMGGAIALYYASEYPEDLDSLVVVDAAGILHRGAFVRTVIRPRFDLESLPHGMQMKLYRLLDSVERFVERIVSGSSTAYRLRERSGEWREVLSRHPNENAALALINTDYSGRLDRIDFPSIIIWGSDDPIAPIRIGHLIDGRLSQGRLHIIEGAGHMPMRTHPAEFREILRSGLDHNPLPTARMRRLRDEYGNDFHCDDEVGVSLSGRYDRIFIDSCVDVRLHEVEARQIVINGSLVRMIDVELSAPGELPALNVTGSAVRVTDARIEGAPALLVDASRMDLAGVSLHSAGPAIRVERGSSFIFSISDIHSDRGVHHLHGMTEISHGVLDAVDGIRSRHSNGHHGTLRTGSK